MSTSAPAPAQPLTTDQLFLKIGVLTVNNEFLSNEVERLNAWIRGSYSGLLAEVQTIEEEAEHLSAVEATIIRATMARVRAKL